MAHQIHIFPCFSFKIVRKEKCVIGVEKSVPIKLCVIGVSGKSKKSNGYLVFFQFLLPKTPSNHYKMVINMIFA